MKIIDARSGKELKKGQGVIDADGYNVEVLDVRSGLLTASALLRTVTVDEEGRQKVAVRWSPLIVRWTHPKYFLQHVGFINS